MTCSKEKEVASGSMCGVPTTCTPTAAPVAMGLGRGLRASGCNVEVDLCGLSAETPQRTPGASATNLFCDEQGLGKVALSTLLAGLVPTLPVYHMALESGNLVFKKDGVVVDSIPTSSLRGTVTHPAYTLTETSTSYKLMKDGVLVSEVAKATAGGTVANYHLTIEGTHIKLVKNGVTVDDLPIPCTCSGCGTTNTPPVAVANAYSTVQGTTLTITDLLANDTDANGDTLTIDSVSTATSGTVTKVNGTTVQYVPATGFTGTATFNYTISDGKGGVATAPVTITVTASGNGGGGSNLL